MNPVTIVVTPIRLAMIASVIIFGTGVILGHFTSHSAVLCKEPNGYISSC